MVVLRPLWERDPIEYLVQWKFPKLAVFRHEAIRKSSSITPEQWQELQENADAYREQLRNMPYTDRQALIGEAQQDEIRRANEYYAAEERKRVFNQPYADADFDHWASASFWTLDEVAALSSGKNPRIVTWETVSSLVKTSPFAKTFADRRDLLHRAGVMGQLAKQTAPSVVLAWAERMRFPMPAELVEAVRSLGMQIADWKTLHDEATSRVENLQTQLNGKHAAHMAALEAHTEYIAKTRKEHGELADGYNQLITKKEEHITVLEQRIEALSGRVAEPEVGPTAVHGERPLMTRERESLLKLVISMASDGRRNHRQPRQG